MSCWLLSPLEMIKPLISRVYCASSSGSFRVLSQVWILSCTLLHTGNVFLIPSNDAFISSSGLFISGFIYLKSFVVAHHKLRLNLFHGFDNHGHDDQKRSAANGQGLSFGDELHQKRQNRDQSQKNRPGQGDAI